MAADVKAFMEDHWIYNAVLMGHSMGGKTAMHLALHHPDLVDKLIVVDMAPKQYPSRHDDIFEALKAVPVEELEDRDEAEKILGKHIDDKAIRLFLMKNLKRNKQNGFRWKMNLPVLEKAYEEILDKITGPEPFEKDTLFLKGGQSSYIEKDDMEDIHTFFPKAELEVIEEAGHWVHSEATDEFLEKVRQFL